jgi:hypothetical protein
MTPVEAFVWGFAGSLAVEVITLFNLYNAEVRSLPRRYRKPGFWLVRFLVAVIAGGFALAYGIQQPLLALNIGVATPLIIKTLGETKPPVPSD